MRPTGERPRQRTDDPRRAGTLRPFVADDAEAMVAILADPEVARLTGSVTTSAELGAPVPLEPTRDWYAGVAAAADRLDLAVVDRVPGWVVGEVVLNEVDEEVGSANFRTLLGPEGRDRGLGTGAVRLLLDHAFGELALHRVSLHVISHNPRARHVYETLGFVLEGTLRESVLV